MDDSAIRLTPKEQVAADEVVAALEGLPRSTQQRIVRDAISKSKTGFEAGFDDGYSEAMQEIGNTFTFTNHKTGQVWDLLGEDGQVDLGKVETIMGGLSPKQRDQFRRRLVQKQMELTAQKSAINDEIADKENTKALIRDLLQTVDAWESSGLKLEKPAGSGLHRLIAALRSGHLHALDDSAKAALVTLGSVKPTSFVVEHDWAAAFANAHDFADGEYKLPFDFTMFEFRASKLNVAVLASESFGAFMFVEIGPNGDWLAMPWDKHADFFSRQIRAICIALDAEVAVAETVRAPEKLNRSRALKGKPPLQDYHVIRLMRRERAAPLPEHGEGHAGKRMHFVRGHWRHFDTHKTWIKWHLRGNPDLGFIDKHYRL